MRYLVTGGAGFIGSNLVEKLVSEGHEVVVLDNMHTGTKENLSGLKCMVIRDSAVNALKRAGDIGKISGIFHLGFPSSTPMYRENPMLVGEAINGMIAMLELAKKCNCKVVYASSSSVYNGLTPPHKEDMQIKVTDYYTEVRVAAERLAELYHSFFGVSAIGLRFFSVYGPHEEAKKEFANLVSQFIWAMKKDEAPVIYGDGSQTRDFTYVDDTVRCIITAMESDVRLGVFNVGTGKETSINELIKLLNKMMGKNIKPKYIINPLKNYVSRTKADCALAKEKLGFSAKIPLEEGIKRLLAGA